MSDIIRNVGNAKEITLPACAKINLFLDITGVLPNGYHSLNNIMQQISLHDNVTVSFEEGTDISVEITCDNPQIPCNEKNIAYKAAVLFLKESGRSGKATISIEKHIPVMAGLGGSSTDGAAVLTALNTLCGSPFSEERLEEMGSSLGADVPFCVRGGAAYCKGIGEQMTDIKSIEHCSIVIVMPDYSCNTSLAYRMYDENPLKAQPEPTDLLKALKDGNLRETAANLYNIFELLNKVQDFEIIRRDMMSKGALGASLSGSGSAVYGIFEEEKAALAALEKLDYPEKIIASPVAKKMERL